MQQFKTNVIFKKKTNVEHFHTFNAKIQLIFRTTNTMEHAMPVMNVLSQIEKGTVVVFTLTYHEMKYKMKKKTNNNNVLIVRMYRSQNMNVAL